MACIYGISTSMATLVLFSRLFPDHNSLIAEAVDAHDVLDGLVPGYEHLSRKEVGTNSLTSTEKKLEEAETDIIAV